MKSISNNMIQNDEEYMDKAFKTMIERLQETHCALIQNGCREEAAIVAGHIARLRTPEFLDTTKNVHDRVVNALISDFS